MGRRRRRVPPSVCVDGNPEQVAWWTELQRTTTSPKNAVRLQEATGRVDVLQQLPLVCAPTLVLHSRHDGAQPFEGGRKLASGIPDARFVPLESRSHVIIEQDPVWPRFIGEILSFLAVASETA
jgi:pimeloyl-ACP methyl ester carboxylesterase